MFGAEMVVGLLGSGTPPSGLALTQTGYESLKLDWTNNELSQQTRIYRSVGLGSFELFHTVAAGIATYTNVGLEAGKSYRYFVRHFDGTRMSDPSNTVTKGLAVAPPSNLVGSVVVGNPKLDWTNGDSNATTVIRRDFVEYDSVAAGVTTYTDTGAAGEFTYDIKHLRNGTESELSDPVVIDTGTGGPSGNPAGLSALASGTNSIDLAWSTGDASATTEIERSPNGSTGWSVIDTVGAGIESYSNTGLSPNTTYYYRVRNTKNGLYSSYSGNANTSTNALPVLSSVSSASHANGNCVTVFATNRVSYTISGNTTGYTLEVEVSIDGTPPVLVETRSPASGTSYHIMHGEHVSGGGTNRSFEYIVNLRNDSGQHATGSPATLPLFNLNIASCP